MVATDARPAIIAVCHPITGHMLPMLRIVRSLTKKNYNVWFLAGEDFQKKVEDAGATFVPLLKACTMNGLARVTKKLQASASRQGIEKFEQWFSGYNPYLKETWIRPMPAYLESLRRAMTVVRESYPAGVEPDVVIISDTITPSVVPLRLGAELPPGYTKRPKTMGISNIPPQVVTLAQGINLGGDMLTNLAGWQGLPYDPREAASNGEGDSLRARNALLARVLCAAHEPLWEDLRFVLGLCGAEENYLNLMGGYDVPQGPYGLNFLGHDTTLQMCVPSLEYNVSEWPKHVKFGGTLPLEAVDPSFEIPDWLKEVRAHGRHGDGTKKVVFATQGTFAVADYKPCILPTIKGLADRDDIIVITTLGVKGQTLDSYFDETEKVPSNAIILDYFSYTLILEQADVVVTNGSYGIFNQCAASGVPMVLAGSMWEDKPHIANRAQYAGIGLHLRSPEPSPQLVADAVDKVLVPGSSYAKRALEIKKEVEDFQCMDNVEREIQLLFEKK